MYNNIYESIAASIKVGYDKIYDCAQTVSGKPDTLRGNFKLLNEQYYKDLDKFLEQIDLKETCDTNRIFVDSNFYENYKLFFMDPTHIVDNIYLGSAFNAASNSTLKTYDIKLVINVTAEISEYFPEDVITYKKYPIYDDNDDSIIDIIPKAYQDIINFQQNDQGNILIHCYMGRSRSASILIYYLMNHLKHDDGTLYSIYDAIMFIKSKRPSINPTLRLIKDIIMLNNNNL